MLCIGSDHLFGLCLALWRPLEAAFDLNEGLQIVGLNRQERRIALTDDLIAFPTLES